MEHSNPLSHVRLCVLERFVEIIPELIEQVGVCQLQPLQLGLLEDCTRRQADCPVSQVGNPEQGYSSADVEHFALVLR